MLVRTATVWFSEGTEFTSAPAKIARITPTGVITKFDPGVADGCNFCIITDVAQGSGGILYITSNDPSLMRFNVATQSFETAVQMPNTSALGGNLAVSATEVWITDFNNDVVWRYDLSNGQFRRQGERPARDHLASLSVAGSSASAPGAAAGSPPESPPPQAAGKRLMSAATTAKRPTWTSVSASRS